LNKLNTLLDLTPLDNSYEIDDHQHIFTFDFENGKHISINIASGSSNYYDDIYIYDSDDEYCFELEEFSFSQTMEFVYEDDKYVCELYML
jgi:hypothetical protein